MKTKIVKFFTPTMLGFSFSQYKWYRKWAGGIWYRITPKPLPYMDFWTDKKPNSIEIVWETENYDKTN